MTDSERLLREITQDHHSGATALTRRAVEALRRRLGEEGGLAGLEEFADRLTNAQPAMASIRNLVERAKAAARVGSLSNTENAIDRFIEELASSTERIAHEAQAVLAHVERVVTISASSTVAAALRDAHQRNPHLSVVCPESRPLREGVTLAESLSNVSISATVCTDALAPSMVRDADVVLIGGDALAPEGLVNKSGTLPLALAAQHFHVPCVALVSRLKVLPRFDTDWIGEMAPAEVAEVTDPRIRVLNRYFELTPLALLSHVVTDHGVIADIAPDHELFA